jgi:hypothetical protein
MFLLDADVNLVSLVGRDALVDLVTELVPDQGAIRVMGIAPGLPSESSRNKGPVGAAPHAT